jgi:hypothetical protein
VCGDVAEITDDTETPIGQRNAVDLPFVILSDAARLRISAPISPAPARKWRLELGESVEGRAAASLPVNTGILCPARSRFDERVHNSGLTANQQVSLEPRSMLSHSPIFRSVHIARIKSPVASGQTHDTSPLDPSPPRSLVRHPASHRCCLIRGASAAISVPAVGPLTIVASASVSIGQAEVKPGVIWLDIAVTMSTPITHGDFRDALWLVAGLADCRAITTRSASWRMLWSRWSTPFRWGRDGDAQADSRTLRLAPTHEGERDAGVASASNRSLSGSWPFAIMSYWKTGDHRRPRW